MQLFSHSLFDKVNRTIMISLKPIFSMELVAAEFSVSMRIDQMSVITRHKKEETNTFVKRKFEATE